MGKERKRLDALSAYFMQIDIFFTAAKQLA